MDFTVIVMVAVIVVPVVILIWKSLCGDKKGRNNVEKAILALDARAGSSPSSWLQNGTNGKYFMLTVSHDQSKLILAAAGLDARRGSQYVHTDCIEVSDIISIETANNGIGLRVGAALPVEIGDSTVFLGGLLNNLYTTHYLKIGHKDIHKPILRLPMPSAEVADEWHARIQSLKMVDTKPAATTDADELLKFKQLMDSGVITQEEFDSAKARILKTSAHRIGSPPLTQMK